MPNYRDKITDLAMRLRPLMLQIAQGAVQANEWDKIIHIVVDGGGSTVYEPTAANLTTALAAATSGDLLYMPPCSISGDFTVPAGVGMASMGNNTVIDGTITLAGDNSHLLGIVVQYSDSSAGTLVGIDCANSSGTVFINDCGITVTNSGAGDAIGIQQTAAGEALIWGCNIYGNATGGGDGYAVDPGTGDVFLEGGYVQGSTDEFVAASAGSGWTAGAEIDTGAITVTSSAGATISGLTPGTKYAVEAFNGPWDRGVDFDPEYIYRVSNDGGITWEPSGGGNYLGRDWLGIMHTDVPSWGSYAEVVNTDYARFYFVATTTSIKIHCPDSIYGDNTGSLSWRLRSATFSAGENNVTVHAVRNAQDGIPLLGDRSAWDTDYPGLHAKDISELILKRHLPEPTLEGYVAVVQDIGGGVLAWVEGTTGSLGVNFDAILTDDNYDVLVDDNGNVLTDDQ